MSDGGTHTLVSHPQDPGQVIAHRYEAAQLGPGAHTTHSQPLAEAVAEALAGPSGMSSVRKSDFVSILIQCFFLLLIRKWKCI